jgi:hypothetical protein
MILFTYVVNFVFRDNLEMYVDGERVKETDIIRKTQAEIVGVTIVVKAV